MSIKAGSVDFEVKIMQEARREKVEREQRARTPSVIWTDP